MPTSSLITGGIETVLNRLIAEQSPQQTQLSRLKGKVISVHLREFDLRLFFVFSQRIDVLSQFEGEVDCALSFKLSLLPQLKEQANLTALIKQDQLSLDGDVQLAQQFSKLLNEIQPDIEDLLSKVMGDVLAYQMVQGATQTQNWLTSKFKTHQSQLGQAITHEWQLAPSALEVAYFCDQVDELNQSLDKLEQRLDTLQQKSSHLLSMNTSEDA
ncbi:MAG: ubiquinone biosynthesis accessory factor UbiJ [Vibrio sp.]